MRALSVLAVSAVLTFTSIALAAPKKAKGSDASPASAAAPQAKNDGGLSILGSLAVAAVADYVKGRIANATKDKIFDPQQASLQITSGDFRWGDGTKLSPEETLHFAGHEGSYYLTYYWEVENV